MCIFIITISCHGQQIIPDGFENFKSSFRKLDLPTVVDQIMVQNLSINDSEIPYSEIKKYILDEEGKPLIEISDNIYNKFYRYGKIKLGNATGLLFLHINENKFMYLSIFNESGNLQWFSKLFSNNGFICNHNDNYATIILPDLLFLKVNENYENSLSADVYEPNQELLFSSYDCDDYLKCNNYKPKYKEIPLSDNLNLKIDISFLTESKLLIPIEFCSPVKISQVLSSIGNENKKSLSSYFIGSKIIKSNRKIVFFLNIYNFENYLNVREVGYQIIDEEGKLIKVDSFCEYAEDKEGRIIIKKTGEIRDLQKNIEIFSNEYGNVEIITFDKD